MEPVRTQCQPEVSAKFGKRFLLCLIAGGVFLLSLALAIRSLFNHLPYFGLYHDDAIYLVSAKSLAEGQGYRILSLPWEPLQTKYPILYPLLLSVLWRIQATFPENLILIESLGIVLGFTLIFVASAYLLKSRRITGLMAVVIGGSTLLNGRYLSFLPIPMSDLLFGILSLLTLMLTEKLAAAKPARSLPMAMATGILAALSALARTAGCLLVPAMVIFLLLRKRRIEALAASGSFLAAMAPYWWWCRANERLDSSTLMWYTSYSHWTASAYKDLGALTIIQTKLQDGFTAVMQAAWPLIAAVPYRELNALEFFMIFRVGYLALWCIVIVGVVLDLLNTRRCLPALYLVLYVLAMLSWPGFTEWRHILIVLPLLYYFYYRGFRFFGRAAKLLVGPGARRQWQFVCAILSVVFAVYLLGGSAFASMEQAGRYPRRFPFLTSLTASVEEADVLSTYRFIRQKTPSSAVFVCNHDPLLYLHTGRKAVQPSPLQAWRIHSMRLIGKDTLLNALVESKAGYLLIDPSYGAAYQAYLQMLSAVTEVRREHPLLLKPVYVSPHGLLSVWAVNREQLR